MSGLPKITLPLVDVRDVAIAHQLALETPEAVGKRIILSADTVWFRYVAETLVKHYPQNGIKTKEFPYCPIKLFSFFS